jgi:glycosyltransferase involved in cell wall biosynthesis
MSEDHCTSGDLPVKGQKNSTGISIIIPAFNAEGTIRRCIESVLKTAHTPLEIIVADDASTDGTADIVVEISKAIDEHVLLIRLEKNNGPARARNEGAAAANYSYFFFLDSDTEMLPNALKNFIARIPEADAVCGHYHWKPLNDNPTAWYKSLLNYYMFSRLGVFEHDVFLGSAAGIRREAFENTGGFDASLKWGMDYENEEFGHRLSIDHKILLDPSIAVHHAFPSFRKLTSTYFIRVSQWMMLFMKRRKFEAGGPAAQNVGLASIAFPLFVTSLAGSLFSAWAWILVAFNAGIYLWGYAGFFIFTLKKRPTFLPLAIVLNGYFCTVISAGAAWGALTYLLDLKNAKD